MNNWLRRMDAPETSVRVLRVRVVQRVTAVHANNRSNGRGHLVDDPPFCSCGY